MQFAQIRTYAIVVYRLAVVLLLGAIAWEMRATHDSVASLSFDAPDVQNVRVINDRLNVSAAIEIPSPCDSSASMCLKPAGLPVRIINEHLSDPVPVQISP